MNSLDKILGGKELTFNLPHIRLAARAWGNPSDIPVLALHGWLDNAASFSKIAPELKGVYLVAIDLAGHGHSEHRHANATYDFIHWILDIHYVLKALDWTKVNLLGHSLGAAIASVYAGTFSENISSLALIDGLGPLSASAQDTPKRLKRAIIATEQTWNKRTHMYSLDKMTTRLSDAIDGLDRTSAEILLSRGAKKNKEGYSWSYDPRLTGPSFLRLTEEQTEAFLSSIECKTLVLRAKEGWPIDDAVIKKRLSYFKTLKLDYVDGCHHTHLVTPQAVTNNLQDFFDSRKNI